MPRKEPQLSKVRVAKLAEKGLTPEYERPYYYRAPNGREQAVKLRFRLLDIETGRPPDDGRDTKTFDVRHRAENGWRWGIGPYKAAALYRLPELLKAQPSRDVYATEGEKDALNGANLFEIVTFSHHQGGAGWTREQARIVAGSEKTIHLIRDFDRVGAQVVWHNARLLRAEGVPTSRIVFLRPKVNKHHADLTDHIRAGYSLGELEEESVRHMRLLDEKYGPLRTGRTGGRYGSERSSA